MDINFTINEDKNFIETFWDCSDEWYIDMEAWCKARPQEYTVGWLGIHCANGPALTAFVLRWS